MALISCPECNKEISDKATACPHCGYPLKEKLEEKKELTKPKKRFSAKEYRLWGFIGVIFCSLLLLILILGITFDNVILSCLITVVYSIVIYVLCRTLLTNKKNVLKYIWIIITVGVLPLIVAFVLLLQNEEYEYDNFKSFDSKLTYINLELNALGQCKYYYSYMDTDNESNNKKIYTTKCTYQKGDKYTFYLEYDGEKTSFDCEFKSGELVCPLQYSTRKITLEKQ